MSVGQTPKSADGGQHGPGGAGGPGDISQITRKSIGRPSKGLCKQTKSILAPVAVVVVLDRPAPRCGETISERASIRGRSICEKHEEAGGYKPIDPGRGGMVLRGRADCFHGETRLATTPEHEADDAATAGTTKSHMRFRDGCPGLDGAGWPLLCTSPELGEAGTIGVRRARPLLRPVRGKNRCMGGAPTDSVPLQGAPAKERHAAGRRTSSAVR